MATTVDTYAGAVASWLKNPGLMGLVVIFALVQLYVLGIAPAIQNTYKVNITAQENIAKNAEATVAGRIAIAQQRTTIAKAKQQTAIAANTPELQQAITEITQQEAIIKAEQETQEDRKAKALAKKAGFESSLTEAQGRVANAIAKNQAATATANALIKCMDAFILKIANENGSDALYNLSVGTPESIPLYRKACVPAIKAKPAPSPQTTTSQPDDNSAALPMNEKCQTQLSDWQQNAPAHAAFVVSSNGHCTYSWNVAKAADAEAQAMKVCTKSYPDCRIYQKK